MKEHSALAVAIAAVISIVPAPAEAMTHPLILGQVVSYTNDNPAAFAGNLTYSTATWSFDDATYLMTQTGGTLDVRYSYFSWTLYRTVTTGLVFGMRGAASAASYQCVEGNFGDAVGASLCGNYSFGQNFINESTATWGPGTAASRTISGDDSATRPQQSLRDLDGLDFVSWQNGQLIFQSATCTGSCDPATGAINDGQRWIFYGTYPVEYPLPPPPVVPIPAAAWLFGSSLVLLGFSRRRPDI